MSTDGTLGGGEILEIIGKSKGKSTWYVDYALEKAFLFLPYVKFIITFLILVLAVVLVLRTFNIKKFGRSRSIRWEMRNVNEIKRRDATIMRQTKLLKRITDLVEKTPFRMTGLRKEYLDYNLARAGLMAPGGYRSFKAEEFNAICQLIQFILIAIAVGFMIARSTVIGALMIGIAVLCCSVLPTNILRQVVLNKDNEIRANFSEMYLMIHYTLISGAQTPLDRVLRSYERTTDSKEMKRFVQTCCNRIDTYGEYGATNYIAADFREIAEVNKLMRLIRQLREGGDIKEELIGFRSELIIERKVALERKGEKLVERANRSKIIITIVMIQVLISMVAIYLPDLGIMTGSFGLGG